MGPSSPRYPRYAVPSTRKIDRGPEDAWAGEEGGGAWGVGAPGEVGTGGPCGAEATPRDAGRTSGRHVGARPATGRASAESAESISSSPKARWSGPTALKSRASRMT